MQSDAADEFAFILGVRPPERKGTSDTVERPRASSPATPRARENHEYF